jgi:hypothetical protein
VTHYPQVPKGVHVSSPIPLRVGMTRAGPIDPRPLRTCHAERLTAPSQHIDRRVATSSTALADDGALLAMPRAVGA